MSKFIALRDIEHLALNAMAANLRIGDVDFIILAERERVVKLWQQAHMLLADGHPGPQTLRALWERHRPSADRVSQRALEALKWPKLRYSMIDTADATLGKAWWPAATLSHKAGDCSDFICHVLGVPKAVTERGRTLYLGSDRLLSGGVGSVPLVRHELADARVGDIVGFPSIWRDGKRVRVGHVGIVVASVVLGGKHEITTVDCSSSGYAKTGNALRRMERVTRSGGCLWAALGGWVMRPAWYMQAPWPRHA